MPYDPHLRQYRPRDLFIKTISNEYLALPGLKTESPNLGGITIVGPKVLIKAVATQEVGEGGYLINRVRVIKAAANQDNLRYLRTVTPVNHLVQVNRFLPR